MPSPNQFSPADIRVPNQFQTPKILPCAEFLPDQASLGNPGCTVARNVLPRTLTSYGPIKTLASFNYTAVPAQVIGAYSFLDKTGSIHVFAGTATKLYRLHTGDAGFVDVTKLAATYTASVSSPWFMTSYGETIIATNGNDAIQKFLIGAANFSDLGGSPPLAKYATTVRDFLFLGFTTEAGTVHPQGIHWSGIGDPATWPAVGSNSAAQLQSDLTDLRSDLGYVRGIAAGLQSADAAIFMDRGVYTVTYIGSPAVFSFQIAQGATGTRFSNSIVSHRGYAYYLSEDGFMAFDGVAPRSIGAQKIDKWFFTDTNDGVNPSYVYLTQGAADPGGKFIYWAYCGPQSTGIPNRILCYNWQLDRWSVARITTNWLTKALALGYGLDSLDAFMGSGGIDTLPYSLDDPAWAGGQPVFTAFDSNNALAQFGGANMAATIETQELQPLPAHRVRVTSARPIVDGATTPTVAIATRQRIEDSASYGTAVTMNAWGICPLREDARYVRAQLNIPASDVWTHCQGVEIDFAQSTRR